MVRICGTTGAHVSRMLKQARLLTRPTPARQDAPCPRQGCSECPSMILPGLFVFVVPKMTRMSPPLRASNEGLLRPRVARAQGTHRAIHPLLAGCFSILLRRFLRFVEHKVHDNYHGSPKHNLLVPEEDFPIVEEDGSEYKGAGNDAVAEGRIFDDRIRPHRDPTEVYQEGNEVDLESPAD